ncbi:MAG: sulfatase-like hydrolase/transferase [Myxococcaceae bacterium]
MSSEPRLMEQAQTIDDEQASVDEAVAVLVQLQRSSACCGADLWPTGLGFDYFFGFIGGDTNQWHPAIIEGIKPIEPPHDQKDYFFDNDLADHAIARIQMLHAVAPDRPWVTYYAPGTAHAPHHAPKEWIAKFKGQFDQGWDRVREETVAGQKKLGIVPPDTKLTPRSEGIPAWDSLDAHHRKVAAHMMEVYAAALARGCVSLRPTSLSLAGEDSPQRGPPTLGSR